MADARFNRDSEAIRMKYLDLGLYVAAGFHEIGPILVGVIDRPGGLSENAIVWEGQLIISLPSYRTASIG